MREDREKKCYREISTWCVIFLDLFLILLMFYREVKKSY